MIFLSILVVLILFEIMYYLARKEGYNDKNLGIGIYLCLFVRTGLDENYMNNYLLNFSIFIFALFSLASKKQK